MNHKVYRSGKYTQSNETTLNIFYEIFEPINVNVLLQFSAAPHFITAPSGRLLVILVQAAQGLIFWKEPIPPNCVSRDCNDKEGRCHMAWWLE